MRKRHTLEMYRHGSLVFGCYDVIQLLKYVRVKDANNYTMIVLECFLSALLHFGVFGICIVLRNAISYVSSTYPLRLSPYVSLLLSPSVCI